MTIVTSDFYNGRKERLHFPFYTIAKKKIIDKIFGQFANKKRWLYNGNRQPLNGFIISFVSYAHNSYSDRRRFGFLMGKNSIVPIECVPRTIKMSFAFGVENETPHIGSISKCSQKCFRFHFGVILSGLGLDTGHAMLITVIAAHKTTQSQKKAHYTSHRTWYKFNEALSRVFLQKKIFVYCVNLWLQLKAKQRK